MIHMTLIERMHQEKFTASKQQVVDYLLSHLDDLSSLSIDDLAKKSFTSHATVIRVCHQLNVQGYRELKIALLKERELTKLTTQQVDYTTPFHSGESAKDIEQKMYSLYQESITRIHHSLDIELLKRIAALFISKKRIFIFAKGDSQISALNLINKLVKINIFPILATQYHEEYNVSQNMKTTDLAFFISYRGDNQSFHECLKILNQKGIPSVILTAHEKSILAKQCHYQFIIPDYEKENKIATFYSQHAFMYVLNNLYAFIYHLSDGQKVQ